MILAIASQFRGWNANEKSMTESEVFAADKGDEDWKALRYLRVWGQIDKGIDIATRDC